MSTSDHQRDPNLENLDSCLDFENKGKDPNLGNLGKDPGLPGTSHCSLVSLETRARTKVKNSISIQHISHEDITQDIKLAVDGFLRINYPVKIDWCNKSLNLLLASPSTGDFIIGVLAMILYNNRKMVHICVLAIDRDWQRQGLGTEMLRQVVIMHLNREITLNVRLDQTYLLRFYCRNGYARLKCVSMEDSVIVLSLVNIMFIADIPLP